jgi:hypothetical protein
MKGALQLASDLHNQEEISNINWEHEEYPRGQTATEEYELQTEDPNLVEVPKRNIDN